MTNINYPLVSLVAILAVCLIAFLIWRNQKDRQQYQKETVKSELLPEDKPKDDKESV
jgi:preprotein translocase subunit YajC